MMNFVGRERLKDASTVGLSLIFLTETQLGNAEQPRWRRVTNGRIIFWQRLCMQRSTGRYFDSWCSFQVVSRSSRPAGSSLLLHPPTGCHRFSAARLFRYFSALSISSGLCKLISTPSSLRSTWSGGWSRSSPSFKYYSKCSFHFNSTWSFFVSSSAFLARHMSTCASNGLFTSFGRL
jgi:hypothetical protein